MKKRQFWKILTLVLALCMLLPMVAACGTEETTDTDATGETADTGLADDTQDSETEEDTEPPVPEDINIDSSYPVKRVDLYTTELSGYRIVIAADADAYVQSAASELSSYLAKAAGYELAVVTDAETAVANEILVGATNRDTDAVVSRRSELTNDGIMYYVENGKLYLGSNTTLGVRYAVYHFLEDWIGCRFYSNDYEGIHEATYIRIPKNLDYSYSSPMMYRYTDWGLTSVQKAKLSLNGEADIPNSIYGFCHTMASLSHSSSDSQPCLTDEGLYQTVLQSVKDIIAAHPDVRVISVTQNDNQNYCECNNCRALAEKEGQSGVLLTFINRLAEEIAQDYPDVYILTFAYQYTRKPPTTVVPAKNVIIWMCSIECCFSHALNDPDCELNAEFCEDIQKWSEITDRLYIWDYTTNYHMYIMPFPNLMVIRENAKFLTEMGAVGIYEEGCYCQDENGEFSQLRSYMLAKLLWNPNMTEEEYEAVMLDFLEGYYGAGYKYVYDYVVQTSEKVTDHHMDIYFCMNTLEYGWLYQKEDGSLDRPFISKMNKLWEKAVAAAETEEQKKHCTSSKLQNDLMILFENAASAKVDAEASRTYIDGLKAAGVQMYGEFPSESRGVDRLYTLLAMCVNQWSH